MAMTSRRFLCVAALFVFAGAAVKTSFAATTPQDMPISCESPKPPGQTGLLRSRGDANVWTFRIVPASGVSFKRVPPGRIRGKAEVIPVGEHGVAETEKPISRGARLTRAEVSPSM